MDAHKIIVEYNEKYNFNKVTCEQGHYMTTWVEGDDIKTFTASTIMYCPITFDLSKYHCITNEEYETLSKLHREAIAKEMEEQRNRIPNTGTTNISGTTIE